MEYASAFTERDAVCAKMRLMQVHQSTSVVAGRPMGELFDLPRRQATPSSTGMWSPWRSVARVLMSQRSLRWSTSFLPRPWRNTVRTTATRCIAARTSTREDQTSAGSSLIKDYQRDQLSCNDAHMEAVQKSSSELDTGVTKETEIWHEQHAKFVVSVADAMVLINLAVDRLSGFYAGCTRPRRSPAQRIVSTLTWRAGRPPLLKVPWCSWSASAGKQNCCVQKRWRPWQAREKCRTSRQLRPLTQRTPIPLPTSVI